MLGVIQSMMRPRSSSISRSITPPPLRRRKVPLRKRRFPSFRLSAVLVVAVTITILAIVRHFLRGNGDDDGDALSPSYASRFRKSSSSLKSSSGVRSDIANLEELNSELETSDQILKWAHDNHGGNLVQVTSFGPSGLVILHKLSQLGYLPTVPVISIDTLHLFPESNNYLSLAEELFPGLNLRVFSPRHASDAEDFDEKYGASLWKLNPDKYAFLTKVEPMLRALEESEASAWITGRRRSQGGERSGLQPIEIDETAVAEEDNESNNNNHHQRYKINPLAHWTYDDVWAYIKKHDIPYNPLYDLGYKSIGDIQTTAKVTADAPERSGRFVGLNKTECGMHAHLEKIKRMKREAEDEGREFEMPSLPCDEDVCLEVNDTNFDDMVLDGNGEMLLEFYSPMCSACQEFAPTFHELAKKLRAVEGIGVARFDVTENEVPESGQKAGFELESTPQIYLVQHHDRLKLNLYKGRNDLDSLLGWLRKTSLYVE